MMDDFNKYKCETNEKVSKLIQQSEAASIKTKMWVERVDTQLIKLLDRNEVQENRFDEFDARRSEIINTLNNLKGEVQSLSTLKLDESKAADVFQEIRNLVSDNTTDQMHLRNDLLTLENYTERYMPLATTKLIKKLMHASLSEEQRKKLDQSMHNFTIEQQEIILTDLGRGSIFENIIQINQNLTERLKFKVDLQEKLLRTNESYAAKDEQAFKAE